MKPYSQDLRQKIISTYLQQKESVGKIAERFQVSVSFVQKLLKNYQQTGSVEPKPHRGGKASKLNSQQLDLLRELVQQDPSATLQELCDRLENKTGVKVSRSTMSRVVRQISSKS